MSKNTNIDSFIANFPLATQKQMELLRATIKKAAPQAEEKMAYGIPTFFLSGNLVHFSAFEHHLGFYPTPSGIAAFKLELAEYITAKGSVQFPLDKPLPIDLITKIVKFRVRENLAKSK